MEINNKIFIVISIFCGFTLYCVLLGGPSVSTDSVTYLDMAENISAGKGIISTLDNNAPVSHFPPLFPMLISLFQSVGVTALTASRMINSICFAACTYILLIITFTISEKKMLFPMASLSLFVFSGIILQVFSAVWTEGFFIFTLFWAFYFLGIFREKQRYDILIASAIFAALGVLDRYVGITVIMASCLYLLFFLRRSFFEKIKYILVYGFISCLPLALWLIRNASHGLSTTNRSFIFHPFSIAHLRQLVRTFLFIFLPDSVIENIKDHRMAQLAVALVFIAFVAIFLIYFQKERAKIKFSCIIGSLTEIQKIFLLFAVVYFVFLVFSISFIDANTPMCYRIIAPMYAACIVFVPTILIRFFNVKSTTYLHNIASLVTILFILSYAARAFIFCADMAINGDGYSGKKWRNSEIIRMIRKSGKDIPVYSNGMDAIYFLTGRIEKGIPSKIISTQAKANNDYENMINRIRFDLKEKKGMLVYFYDIPICGIPDESEICNLIPLRKCFTNEEGSVYLYGGD